MMQSACFRMAGGVVSGEVAGELGLGYLTYGKSALVEFLGAIGPVVFRERGACRGTLGLRRMIQ